MGRQQADEEAAVRIVQIVTLVSRRGVFGGPTTVALAQLRELRRIGHDVVLLGLRDGADDADEVEGVPVQLFRDYQVVPAAGLLGRLHPRLLAALWRAVARADVVHVHVGRDLVSLSALLICRVRRRPYVTQTHGMVMPRESLVARLFDVALRPLLRGARYRFVLTDSEAEGLGQVVPGAPTTRLANGVLVPVGPARSIDAPPMVTFLARLHPRKRVGTFLDVATELAARGVVARFCVYGPDEGDLPQLRRGIQRLATLTPPVYVSYGGALSHEAAVEALADSDVYVLPSVNEPFPMTVLEALAQATPSIFVDTCGLAPLLPNRRGAVITDGSVEQLTSAVAVLVADPAQWAEASLDARSAVTEQFSVGAVADTLLAAYDDALSARLTARSSLATAFSFGSWRRPGDG
ncbi:MAG: glycosyltransferase [Pseudonocardiales bacterium]